MQPTHKPNGWSEDWTAVHLGLTLLAFALVLVMFAPPELVAEITRWLAKMKTWQGSFLGAFANGSWRGTIGAFAVALVLFGLGHILMRDPLGPFLVALPFVFGLAAIAFLMASQSVVKHYGLSYALWALLLGLTISNTIGTPQGLLPAVRTELFIKTGLVLLGAEVLISKLMALGLPGVCIAWLVTPVVLVTTFWFGQRILKIQSPSLNMVISADMSVCGVSAAIATAAACRAKKEELSIAIGLSLTFTVVMMVLMPPLIRLLGLSEIVGGAWMGGTIDSTGAVGAAGAMLGDDALTVATAIKMIQNILIGFVAFFVAIYWVSYHPPGAAGPGDSEQQRPRIGEIWVRFPKFVIGFLAASLVFSLIYARHPNGPQIANTVIKSLTKSLRSWFFCLAFVSIGLETNFRELTKHLAGGKPLVLYLCGQTLNLCLTLLMAWLMFERVFPGAADAIAK